MFSTQNRVTGDLLNILIGFLKERKQRVVLNDYHSMCQIFLQGFHKGRSLDFFFFLKYVNDLLEYLSLNPKLIAEDTSPFRLHMI